MPATPGYNQKTQEVVSEWLKLKSTDKIKIAIEKKGVVWLKENFSSIDDLYKVAGGRDLYPATGEDFFCPLLRRFPVQQVMMSLVTVLNKHKLLLPLLTQQGVKEDELDIFLKLLEEFQRYYYQSYDTAVAEELEKQLQAQGLQYDRNQVKGLKQTIEQIQHDGEELRKRDEGADNKFISKLGDVELGKMAIKNETSKDEEEWVEVDSPVSTGHSSPEF